MHTITALDIIRAKNERNIVTLASSTTDKKKLDYDYLFKSYTIYTENRTSTTSRSKEAAQLYNAG